MILDGISSYIAAAAGLGTAAFSLVDVTKAFDGGVSNYGFPYIRSAVEKFIPADAKGLPSSKDILMTLRANWLNGTAFADQKAIAKSLIKLRLDAGNAARFATTTGVDATILGAVATKIASGTALSIQESDAYGRFDLMLTAILDEAYQRADQVYRNSAKAWSVLAAVGLAIAGVLIVEPNMGAKQWVEAIVVGLAATPLAPIAKDLTSALQAGVKVAQLIGK